MIRKLGSTTTHHPRKRAAKRFLGEERVSYERPPQSAVFPGDEQLKEEIKEAIAKDSAVATIGNEIDIIVSHGMVTLRGEVLSGDEKITIGDKAVACAGFGKVINQLDVAEGEE